MPIYYPPNSSSGTGSFNGVLTGTLVATGIRGNNASSPLNYVSLVADGTSSVAHVLSTTLTYSAAGSKLFQVLNGPSTEVFSVENIGNLNCANVTPTVANAYFLGSIVRPFSSLYLSSAVRDGNGIIRLNVPTGGASTYLDSIPTVLTSSAAHVFSTRILYETLGNKLLLIQNLGIEKASFDPYGKLSVGYADTTSDSSGASTVQTPSGRAIIPIGTNQVSLTSPAINSASICHAWIQQPSADATLTSIPRTNVTAITNWLWKSEDFTNNKWGKGAGLVLLTGTVDPLGGTNAITFVIPSGTAFPQMTQIGPTATTSSLTFSIWGKSSVGTQTARMDFFDSTAGAATTGSDISLTTSWTRFSISTNSFPVGHIVTPRYFPAGNPPISVAVTSSAFGAQLELTGTMGAYARSPGPGPGQLGTVTIYGNANAAANVTVAWIAFD